MTDKEYAADQAAEDIDDALSSGKKYMTEIDKLTYDALLTRLRARHPALHPSVFLVRGIAIVQFSGISAATFVVSSTHPLSRESFTADCVFKEAAQPLAWWPKALIADIALLKWFILPVCLVGTCLLAIQTTADLHDYFALVAQVLAIVFTLYAVLRRSLTNQDQQEWEDAADGAIDRDYQDERIIGVTAIGAIAICLLEFLLTTKSIAQWDQEHLILIGDLHLLPARWLSVAIGTVHIALLTSLFRTLVFYYPDREFGQRLLHVRNKWFAERHLAASATAEAFEESVSTHNRRV